MQGCLKVKTISLTLPYPPSTNRYWRNVRGRMIVSPEAKAYKAEVGWLARQAGIEPLEGELFVTARVYRPRKAGDLSNRQKVLEDALEGFAYLDDSQIAGYYYTRHDDKKNPRVELEIDVME